MSLTSSLQRIVSAKADIKTSIEAKGVTVPNNASIVDYPDYIDAITTGGGGGGSTLVVPLASNITLNGATLSWDAPDLTTITDYTQYDPVFEYLVILNEGNQSYESSFITTQTTIDIFGKMTTGSNQTFTISIYVILKLTNDENTEKTNLYYPYYVTQEIGGTSYLPVSARGMGIGVVGTDIYLFGGNASSGNINTINKFNTTTNTISTLATTLPSNMYGMGVGVNGTDIYLLGGWTTASQTLIQKFDTTTNTLTTLNVTLPVGMSNMGYATVGTNVYLFGGYLSSGYSNNIYKFDMSTETITTLSTTLPYNVFDLCAVAVGTDIYLFGGAISQGNTTYNYIYKFSTSTEALTTLNSIMQYSNLRAPGCAAIGNDIFILGGFSSNSYKNYIWRFNCSNDTIYRISISLNSPRRGIAAATVGDSLYFFGGMSSSSWYPIIGELHGRVQ